MPPVYLINLARCPDRLTFMAEQLQGLGVNWVRVDAIDASAGDFVRPPSYRWLKDAEVAVWQSHRACWERIVSNKSGGGVVLEDDTHLASSFPELLGRLDGASFDLVKLETGQRKVFLGESLAHFAGEPAFRVQRLLSWHGGAAGYFVSARACEELLAVSIDQWPVDVLLFEPMVKQPVLSFHPAQLVPAVVVQDQILASTGLAPARCFESTIAGRPKATRGGGSRGIARAFARIKYKLRVWLLRAIWRTLGRAYEPVPFAVLGR